MSLRRQWDRRVTHWHSHVTSAAAFERVLDRLVAIAGPGPGDTCVDLGAGTGFVAFALAPMVKDVLAFDISPAMARSMTERAREAGIGNVRAEVADLAELQLGPQSADLIVSSYALHHLHDHDKRELVLRAAGWLRPGGRLVIADMMFGRGGSQRDRQILRQKAAALAAKGPGGWWRIAKNMTRFGLGIGHERPATPGFWQSALREAGFAGVTFEPVVAEAGIVSGMIGTAAASDTPSAPSDTPSAPASPM